jgi:S-methylmethionine-dependent homocysteine/selenocysteine methylase
MPSRKLADRLEAGEALLMDGATGSELQRRGVKLAAGATKDSLGVWSATANVDAPEVVQGVHEDYLKLGADIVISNSFWTNRPRLAIIGQEERWEEYTRKAGELAVAARDSMNRESYVAGGVAPPGSGDLHTEFADQARILAAAGVDVMLPEYVGTIEDCVTAVDACATAGLPVLLGVRHGTIDGTMQYGDSFADLASALDGHKVDAVLLMCTRPDPVSACLPKLRDAFDGPIGCYSNVGYYTRNPQFGATPSEAWHTIDTSGCLPERYAEYAREWREMGAQIIGGCCAAGPEHIEAIRDVVKGS